jgi:hypothetical protein
MYPSTNRAEKRYTKYNLGIMVNAGGSKSRERRPYALLSMISLKSSWNSSKVATDVDDILPIRFPTMIVMAGNDKPEPIAARNDTKMKNLSLLVV